MPDYNPAVATGIAPQGNALSGTFDTIMNLQRTQAQTGLLQLQQALQQRKLNGLAAATQAYQAGEDPVVAGLRAGLDPQDAAQFQNLGGTRTFMNAHGGLLPQGAEATANIGRIGAETRNLNLQAPGIAAESQTKQIGVGEAQAKADIAQRNDAAQAAQHFLANPTDENWDADIVGHAQQYYQGNNALDKASGIKSLRGVTDPAQRAKIASSAFVGGLTAEQGGATVETQNPQGAPVYQTRAQFVAGGPAVGQSAQQKAEAEKQGAALGEYLPKVQDEAAAAKNMNFTLGQMEDESKKFTMGAYAPTLTTFAKYLKPLANSVGNTSFDNWVGSNEDFAKNAGVLARQGVREISNRPSQFEYQAVASQMPHDAMSEQGFKGITDQFRAINDFKQAKAFAAQGWQTSKGTMAGFEADWNKNIGPAAFLIANMPPEQRREVVARLSQSQRDSISRQLQWAHDNKLENGVF